MNDWDHFKNIPLGVLAHSTHLRGSGVMENGIERPNVRVTLASKISAEDCARLNLGYLDPAKVNVDEWRGKEDEGILYVSKAGEISYRINKLAMTFEYILRDHLARYPSMQIQDVYKLIHQAALGSEHASSKLESARKRMDRELVELDTGPDELVIDPISADSEIVRVHLRPFLAQGGDPKMLLEALVRTANEYRGDLQVLKSHWSIAASMEHFQPTKRMISFNQCRHRIIPLFITPLHMKDCIARIIAWSGENLFYD